MRKNSKKSALKSSKLSLKSAQVLPLFFWVFPLFSHFFLWNSMKKALKNGEKEGEKVAESVWKPNEIFKCFRSFRPVFEIFWEYFSWKLDWKTEIWKKKLNFFRIWKFFKFRFLKNKWKITNINFFWKLKKNFFFLNYFQKFQISAFLSIPKNRKRIWI